MKRSSLVPLAIVLGAMLLSALAWRTLLAQEHFAYDARLELRTDGGWPDDLVLVPVDDAAIEKVGAWPWPRDRQAELLDALARHHVKTVLYGIGLGPASTPAADSALAAAIARSHAVLAAAYDAKDGMAAEPQRIAALATAGVPAPEQRADPDHLVMPLPQLAAASGWVGIEVFPPSGDGVVRTLVPIANVPGAGAVPSASVLAWLRQHDRLPRDLKLDDGGETLRIPGGATLPLAGGALPLDFAPRGKPVAMISAREVLDDDDPLALESALSGKLAIVGLENLYGGAREFAIPDGKVSGLKLLAYELRTIDGGRVPSTPPVWIVMLALALVAAAGAIPLAKRTQGTIFAVGVGAAVALVVVSAALVRTMDVFLPLVAPAFFLEMVTTGLGLRAGRLAEQERKSLKALLERAQRLPMPAASGVSAQAEAEPPAPTASLVVRQAGDEKTAVGGRAGGAGRSPQEAAGSPKGDQGRTPGGAVPAEPPTAPSNRDSFARAEREAASVERLLFTDGALEEPVDIGRYRVQRTIGRGGMGAIFLALDRDLDRPVAMKILQSAEKEAFARFRREAMTVARLQHPNVVQIYEVGLDAKVPYLVMEYVPGGTLTDLFRDPEFPKPMPWRLAATILAGMARGLGAAHKQGIIHRDVKPDNVLMSARKGEGMPKIADFGIAKLAGESPITRTGLIVGTVGYLSPEQAMGKAIDPRSDVYCLSLIAHRMLTGKRPFTGTPEEQVRQALVRPVPDPRDLNPEVPLALAELVNRMGEIAPDRRPKDGTVVAQAIDPLLMTTGEQAVRSSGT